MGIHLTFYMTGFIVKAKSNVVIRFNFYVDSAPLTCAAFAAMLPFERTFLHARVSGQEIWIDNAHRLDIIQENASVFTTPGEIVLGPVNPLRTKTAGCIGIYYGEGRGLDCCNIFGKVFDEDVPLLKALGELVWKQGAQQLWFDVLQ
jgi:hypothetical protein